MILGRFFNQFLFLILFMAGISCEAMVARRTASLFAHGMCAALQIKKYWPAYQPPTGDVLAVEQNDFKVLYGPVATFWFPEVALNTNGGRRASLGIANVLPRINIVFDRLNKVISGESSGISFVDYVTDGPTLKNYSVALGRVNFGQEDDIAAISAAYDDHVRLYPGHDHVLFGPSRGAAAIFNFLATDYATKPDQLVKAVVLDGCFDDLTPDLLGSYLMENARITQAWIHNYVYSFFQRATRFDSHGIMPIKVIATYPKDLPTLFIASKKDMVVPFNSTERVYRALKDAGHKHVYLLVLENSNHCAGMLDDPRDKENYEAVVNAFYKLYDLDHDAQLAQKGMPILLSLKG